MRENEHIENNAHHTSCILTLDLLSFLRLSIENNFKYKFSTYFVLHRFEARYGLHVGFRQTCYFGDQPKTDEALSRVCDPLKQTIVSVLYLDH